jgi:hypothetical protein
LVVALTIVRFNGEQNDIRLLGIDGCVATGVLERNSEFIVGHGIRFIVLSQRDSVCAWPRLRREAWWVTKKKNNNNSLIELMNMTI